jgi:hypothetical protein
VRWRWAGMKTQQAEDSDGAHQPLLSGAGGAARRGTGTLIAVCVVAVCILAVAVSTREAEFDAYTGFAEGEEERVVSKALLPVGAREFLLHVSGLDARPQSLDDDGEDKPMTADDVDARAEQWARDHPEEMNRITLSFAAGLALGIMGTVLLLWSEISTVVTVRELDRHAWSGEPKPVELAEREALWAHGFGAIMRPWLSLGGVLLMLFGFLFALIPMCSILVDFGMPEVPTRGDCITSIVLLAVLDVIGFAALLVSLCWCCTRPLASLVLSAVALGAQVCLLIKSPVFIICWVVTGGFLAFYYFQFLPESKEGYVPRPDIFHMYNSAYQGQGQSQPRRSQYGPATHYV